MSESLVSPDGSDPERPGESHAATEVPFRRTVLLTVLGAAIPGAGLIAARRHLAGLIILGVFLTGILALVIFAALDRSALIALAVEPTVLRGLGVALIALAVAWVGVVVVSHLALRGSLTRARRTLGWVLVGVLSFAVAAPLVIASRYAGEQASLVGTVFRSEDESKSATRPTLSPDGGPEGPAAEDPWAGKPRLNVLLLGGDADKGREGTRTDTVILASINTATGDTTLFSLPRNTARMPFPSRSPLKRYYPRGFTNGNGNDPAYFLNAMYQSVPATVPKNVLGETDNLGADALKLSVGAALGLQVDYYVLINIRGFDRLIDALGGIRVNVNTYVPIGGDEDSGVRPTEQITPGPDKLLMGRDALWFARGRYGTSDYVRMDRQRCVINAIIRQANPANVLARYEKIAQAGKQIVRTDIPQEVLPMIVDLSLRVKDGNVRSIVFRPGSGNFVSARPPFMEMRRRVKAALDEAEDRPASTSPQPSPSPSSTGPSGGSPGPTASPRPTKEPAPRRTVKQSADTDLSCRWRPEVAATSAPFVR